MTHKERQGLFAEEIERVIDYFRKEYNLTYADAVGVLQITATDLAIESRERAQQEDESVDDSE